MKLPNFKRLTTNDFEEQDKKFVEQLGFCMNDGFQNLYDALNKKLTIDDNFLGALKDVDVRVDANGTPLVSTFVNTGISVVPKRLWWLKQTIKPIQMFIQLQLLGLLGMQQRLVFKSSTLLVFQRIIPLNYEYLYLVNALNNYIRTLYKCPETQ